MYRTKLVNPDYRHSAKTLHYCCQCQRDLAGNTPERWVAYELDTWGKLIYPADLQIAWVEISARRAVHHAKSCIVFERIGPECERKIGHSWSMSRPEMELAFRGDSMNIEFFRPRQFVPAASVEKTLESLL